jgi:hypothetical protein
VEPRKGAADFGLLSIREFRQKAIGCGGESAKDPVVERESARRECDPNFASVLIVGSALDEVGFFESFQDFGHSTRRALQSAMELAGTERVGSARISQSRENVIVAGSQLEGFEDVDMDALALGAQPRQSNE